LALLLYILNAIKKP